MVGSSSRLGEMISVIQSASCHWPWVIMEEPVMQRAGGEVVLSGWASALAAVSRAWLRLHANSTSQL